MKWNENIMVGGGERLLNNGRGQTCGSEERETFLMYNLCRMNRRRFVFKGMFHGRLSYEVRGQCLAVN